MNYLKPIVNIRFAHYPTRTPILLELTVEASTTVQELHSLVEERLTKEEHCLMRVFDKWYTDEVTNHNAGINEKNLIPIDVTDNNKVLAKVGIEDESVIYLEGPLTGTLEGLDTALAIVSSHSRRQAAQQTQLLQHLMEELKAIKESHMRLQELVIAQQAQLKASVEAQGGKIADQLEAISTTVDNIKESIVTLEMKVGEKDENTEEEEEQEEDSEELKAQAITIANAILSQPENQKKPLKAFYEVLQDQTKFRGPYVAMAIVRDARCGIERALTDDEVGLFKDMKYPAEFKGATPLIIACFAGRVDVLEELIVEGAQLEAKTRDGRTAVQIAVETDNGNALELLIDEGADYSRAMHSAIMSGKANAIGVLIDKGESFGEPCYVGPMHTLASWGHAAALEMMISKGAYVDMPMSTKKTPLHYAAESGKLAAIELLVSKGANIHLQDRERRTPLMMLGTFNLSEQDQARAIDLLTNGLPKPSVGANKRRIKSKVFGANNSASTNAFDTNPALTNKNKSDGEVVTNTKGKSEETITKSGFPAQAPPSVFGKAPAAAGFGPAAASAFGSKPATAFGQNAAFGAFGKPALLPADAAKNAAVSKDEAKKKSPEVDQTASAPPSAFGKAAVAPGFGQTAAAPFGSSKSPSPAPPAAEGDKPQTESVPKTEPTKSPSAGNPFGKPSVLGVAPANTFGLKKDEAPNAISKPSSPSPAAGTENSAADATKEAVIAKADDSKNAEGASATTPTPSSSEASTPPPPDGTKDTEPIKEEKVDAAVAPNPNQAAKSAFSAAVPPASVFGGKSIETSAFGKALVASAFGAPTAAAFGNKTTATNAFGQAPTSAFPKPSSPPPPNPGAGKDGTVDEATQVPSAPVSGAGYQKDEATQMPSAPVSGVPQNDNLPLTVASNAAPADGQTAPPASGFPSNTNIANSGFPNTSSANSASSAFNTNQVSQPNPTASVFGQASNSGAGAFASARNNGAFTQSANPFPNNTNSAFPPANQGGQPNGADAFAQSNANSAFSQANQGNNQPNAFAAALGGGNNSNGAGSGGSSGFAAAASNPSVFGSNVGNKSAFSGSVGGGAFAGASSGNNNNPSGGVNAFGNAQAQRTGFGSVGGSAFGKGGANTQSAFANQPPQNNNFKSAF